MSFVGEGDKLKLSTWLMEDGQGKVQDLSAVRNDGHISAKASSSSSSPTSDSSTWTFSVMPLPEINQETPLPVLEPTWRPSEPVYNFPIRL